MAIPIGPGGKNFNALTAREASDQGAAKKDILAALTGAQRELTRAYILATQANPMAADLPCFNRMRAIGTEITALMAEVSKVRGL